MPVRCAIGNVVYLTTPERPMVRERRPMASDSRLVMQHNSIDSVPMAASTRKTNPRV